MGYHTKKIEKGILGEASKIIEEIQEWEDAYTHDNPIMELIELSDLLGAIEAYTIGKYNINLRTLIVMTRATQSAFRDGTRK